MTATYINTFADNHGIDYTTDTGKKGFIHGILDADTARTLAAGPEAIELVRTLMVQLKCHNIGLEMAMDAELIAKAEKFLTNLHAQK